jgi:hypothetical protein
MEDNSDVDSDGSNIDIGNFDENDDANDDFEIRKVNRNANKWLEVGGSDFFWKCVKIS